MTRNGEIRLDELYYVITIISSGKKAGDFFNIPLQGPDGVTGDLGILKFEGAQQVLFQLCISGRGAFQSLNNKSIAGKIEIFFHGVMFVLWSLSTSMITEIK